MKTVVALIFMLWSSPAFSQDSQANERVIYQFVRDYFNNSQKVVLQQETYRCLSCSTQEDDQRALEQLKGVVSEQEIAYLMQQYQQMTAFSWNADSLQTLTLMPHQTITRVLGNRGDYKRWQRFKRQYGKSLYTINKPLLTQDQQTLLVYIEEMCGDDCGWGKLAIFRKENGAWKEVARVGGWIH
jgi:hypothetical protein